MYKLNGAGVVRLADGANIPADPLNADYQRYLADIEKGADVQEADPEPTPEPSRDERLLEAVEQAKSAVSTGSVFTKAQVATLSACFDGLAQAITGVQP